MNAHAPIPASVLPAGDLRAFEAHQRRQAHVTAALTARRTAHHFQEYGRDNPDLAVWCRIKAANRYEASRYELNRARDIDAWLEWRNA